jgi:uncharacterized protein YyaL (SSP411 family)
VNEADFYREQEEGAFYTWTKKQIIDVLGETDGQTFCTHFHCKVRALFVACMGASWFIAMPLDASLLPF